MKLSSFNATSPFEIGDKVQTAAGIQTITDIACVHYCRSGKVIFMYELDNNKSYVKFTVPQPLTEK